MLFLKNDGKAEGNSGYNIYGLSHINDSFHSLIFFIYLLDYSLITGGCHLLPKPTVVLEEETPASSSSSSSSNTATRKKSYENINILERLEEEASDEPQEGIHLLIHELTHVLTHSTKGLTSWTICLTHIVT